MELTATNEDSRVLDALAHARRHKSSREYIPAFDDAGNPVDISFATQNWQRNVRDRDRPGSFVRRHFEAIVFNTLDIVDVVRELQAEGWIIEPEDLARVSPT